jgi:hypothetical protein
MKDPSKLTGRIDTIAADVNALALYMAGQDVAPSSPWDDPEFTLEDAA